jgi:hypothetical protein
VERERSDRLELDPDAARQDRLRHVLGRPAEPGVRHAAVATLRPDRDSPYDSLAVGVWLDGVHVGWLTHADSARIHAIVTALSAAGEVLESAGVIEYVGVDEFGAPRLGVWLPFDRDEAARRAAEALGRPDSGSAGTPATVPEPTNTEVADVHGALAETDRRPTAAPGGPARLRRRRRHA